MTHSAKPSLEGQICIVTGANTGIGWETAATIAGAGAKTLLACRSEVKARAAIEKIRTEYPAADLEFLELDLNSLAATRRSAEAFLDKYSRLDLLINNAGLAGTRGQTEDGFELAFGVNHLGHYLFTRLLLEKLISTAKELRDTPARVVHVSSRSHFSAKRLDLSAVKQRTSSIAGLPEYSVSKLANVLFSAELARRVDPAHLTSYSLHPGMVASDVWRHVPWPVRPLMKRFMLTNAQGAETTLHCALSLEAGSETGLYYDKRRPRNASRLGRDLRLAKELWDQSAEWVGLSPEL